MVRHAPTPLKGDKVNFEDRHGKIISAKIIRIGLNEDYYVGELTSGEVVTIPWYSLVEIKEID